MLHVYEILCGNQDVDLPMKREASKPDLLAFPFLVANWSSIWSKRSTYTGRLNAIGWYSQGSETSICLGFVTTPGTTRTASGDNAWTRLGSFTAGWLPSRGSSAFVYITFITLSATTSKTLSVTVCCDTFYATGGLDMETSWTSFILLNSVAAHY